MLVLLFVSFCIPFLDQIWHAGSDPLGYLSRYSFLFCFVLIRCAWMELSVCRDESEAGGGLFPPGTVPALLIPAALCIYVFLFPCPYLDMKKKILNGILFTAAIAFALTGRIVNAFWLDEEEGLLELFTILVLIQELNMRRLLL